MPKLQFLVDTGATRTTIPKATLIDRLGYTDTYIQSNKKLLPDNEKPLMANGNRADVYMINATRFNIGGYEIQPHYILTSDTIMNLNLLMGLDLLRNFLFTFDFDAIDAYAPYGRMLYELRETVVTPFTKLGEPFAHQLNEAAAFESDSPDNHS